MTTYQLRVFCALVFIAYVRPPMSLTSSRHVFSLYPFYIDVVLCSSQCFVAVLEVTHMTFVTKEVIFLRQLRFTFPARDLSRVAAVRSLVIYLLCSCAVLSLPPPFPLFSSGVGSEYGNPLPPTPPPPLEIVHNEKNDKCELYIVSLISCRVESCHVSVQTRNLTISS